MGLLKTIKSIGNKIADTVDDITEGTGIKDVAEDIKDYAEDTFDELKDAVTGNKEKKE